MLNGVLRTTMSEVTNLQTLLHSAKQYRGNDFGPVLYVIGRLSRSINIDGTVANRVGQVFGKPVYRVEPRVYKVLEGGSIKITDDHEDWFGANNNETVVIDRSNVEMALIAEPCNKDLQTPCSADNVVQYPCVSD